MSVKDLLKNTPLAKMYFDSKQKKARRYNDSLTDEEFVREKFKKVFGREIDLKNPVTYNEKLQWLKLYDRKPFYSTIVDKYEVKKYIAEKIGEQYIIPTLGIWEHFDDIDFNALPDKFVLKCTHDSGGLVICTDKSKLDKKAAKKKIEASLKRNYYWQSREWPYKNVKPRIIAEAYMEDSKTKELRDYKFFCFDGEVKALFIATERQKEGEDVKFDYFDTQFNHLPFKQGHENADILPEKPKCFDEMIRLAAELSKGIPHVRVDFYEVDGRIFFGELTCYHFGGLMPFEPEEWDYTFGSWLKLPPKTEN